MRTGFLRLAWGVHARHNYLAGVVVKHLQISQPEVFNERLCKRCYAYITSPLCPPRDSSCVPVPLRNSYWQGTTGRLSPHFLYVSTFDYSPLPFTIMVSLLSLRLGVVLHRISIRYTHPTPHSTTAMLPSSNSLCHPFFITPNPSPFSLGFAVYCKP